MEIFIFQKIRPFLTETSKTEGFDLRFVALEHGELMRRFKQDDIDAVLTIDTDPSVKDFSRRVHLGTDYYCAAIPKDHPFAKRDFVEMREIAREDFIAPDPYAMSGMHDFIMRQFANIGEKPNIISYYEDIPTFMAEVAFNTGIGMVLNHHRERYKNSVEFVPISDCKAICNVCYIWKRKLEDKLGQSWKTLSRHDSFYDGESASQKNK